MKIVTSRFTLIKKHIESAWRGAFKANSVQSCNPLHAQLILAHASSPTEANTTTCVIKSFKDGAQCIFIKRREVQKGIAVQRQSLVHYVIPQSCLCSQAMLTRAALLALIKRCTTLQLVALKFGVFIKFYWWP